jgi:hypothetical protein
MHRLKNYIGSIAGLTTLLIVFIAKNFPEFIDVFYGQGLYPIVRSILDLILVLFPFSLLLLFILLVLFLLVSRIRKRSFSGVLNLVGWLLFAFYWLWGFNYFKSSLNENLNLEVLGINLDQREALVNSTLQHAILLSDRLEEDAPLPSSILKQDIILACEKVSKLIDGITTSNTAPVAMFPKTLFLRIGITGMYFPFTGQAHYEPLLGNISLPYTMAHEWFHAGGVAPESEANFLAYISLMYSKNDELKYAAQMNLLIELLIFYKLTDHPKYLFYREQFTSKMDIDLKNRNALYQKYSNVVSQKSDVVINQYLKMQNQVGVSDYHRLADWVVAWKRNESNSP